VRSRTDGAGEIAEIAIDPRANIAPSLDPTPEPFMSYRMPSRKMIARLAIAGCWTDDDVVLTGTDALGRPLRISRGQAAVPASLVRSWLVVRNAEGQPRLTVVGDFVSADGCLFRAPSRRASQEPGSAAGASGAAAP
jgi:hypothetical protein